MTTTQETVQTRKKEHIKRNGIYLYLHTMQCWQLHCCELIIEDGVPTRLPIKTNDVEHLATAILISKQPVSLLTMVEVPRGVLMARGKLNAACVHCVPLFVASSLW